MKELLHFTAKWCKPCEKLKPIIEEYMASHQDILWDLVDVDTEFAVAEEHNVLSIPTLILLEGGKEIKRHQGIATKQEIEIFLS